MDSSQTRPSSARRQGKSRPLLLVEDDPTVLEQLSDILREEGYALFTATTAKEGMDRLEGEDIGLVITDLNLPDGSGMSLMEKAKELSPGTPVLVITAYASVDSAVEAMRKGAFHYIQKPFSMDTILIQIERALEHGMALRERTALRKRLSAERGLGRIIGKSPVMDRVREMISGAAATDSTVLVAGETGTGKELVVSALHFESERASGPLVSVNCAALTESLLESELFGHEKGAFTGAERQRKGRFEHADGGTLFLDEITEMGEHIQAKLLRVLQGSEFERVGGNRPIRSDVRVVAATNRNPMQAVQDGRLREDLYYRLNVVTIDVPPLRERTEDIPLLARHFLSLYSARHKKSIRDMSREVLDVLCSYAFPGNVRELENAVERAVIFSKEQQIRKIDLPAPLSGAEGIPGAGAPRTLNLNEVEKRTILRALDEAGWNKSRAAEKLGIFASSLYKKMKRLGIPLQKTE
jgi:two-component system response regulator HydG